VRRHSIIDLKKPYLIQNRRISSPELKLFHFMNRKEKQENLDKWHKDPIIGN
jgi:hypothetical protein